MSKCCNTSSTPLVSTAAARWVALVGNPNTGKTTVFNALTGLSQRVGNFPGVTVEKKTGFVREGEKEAVLVDLPGCYSLAARSPDEMVAIDVLLGKMPDCKPPELIVVVVDASNIERNLYLTTQLLELGLPVVVCLNMMDMAEADGIRIDTERLAKKLGVTIFSTTARKGRGLHDLRRVILDPSELPTPKPIAEYPTEVIAEADRLDLHFSGSEFPARPSRFECLRMLLEVGGYLEKRWNEKLGKPFQDAIAESRRRIEAVGHDLTGLETHMRYQKIGDLLARYVSHNPPQTRTMADRLDSLLTHRVFGTLIFLMLMALIFQSIYSWAAPIMDSIDWMFGTLAAGIGALLPEGAVRSLITDGVISGVGAVVIFLPQILILFFFIAVLEDCGYLPRAAFLMDRLLSKGGLSGKAFIPLLSSFACAIPGIMATRVIENRRDRFITIFVAPLMSCSARLPIYTIMIGTFIPSTAVLGGLLNLQGVVLFMMYCLGAAISIPVALTLHRIAFKGDASRLMVMELPPYQLPSARNVFMRMYIQGKVFLVRAGTVIFMVSVMVWVLTYFPRSSAIVDMYDAQRAQILAAHGLASADDELPAEMQQQLDELDALQEGAQIRQSFLGRMGRLIEPLVEPLGWDWRIGTAVVASFPAREIVVAALGIIYDVGSEQDETSQTMRDNLRAAQWPDGRKVYTLPVVFSIMVFFALCAQCGATLATIRRETNSWKWPTLVFTYMTVLAYSAALLVYQVGTLLSKL